MKATQIECDSCGAKLAVDGSATSVTCEYCGTASQIERAPSRRADPPTPPRRKAGLSLVMVLIPLILLLGAGITAFVLLRGGRSAGPIRDSAVKSLGGVASRVKAQWEGVGRALLADIDGDGIADPIGRTRHLGVDRVHPAAFNGRTGELLWEGPVLGTYSETYQGKLSLVDKTLLYGSARGEVWAFSPKDGKRLWQIPVGEKIKDFCQAPAGQVGVLTLDKQLRLLQLSDGTERGKSRKACAALPHDRRDGDPKMRHSYHVHIQGMRVSNAYSADGELFVVSGSARPGTQVPMVAVVRGKELVWKSEVPATDRLGARTGPPAKIAFSEAQVATVYRSQKTRDPARVALFRITDGRRLWEATLPSAMPVASVQVTKDLVLVSTWGSLTAYNPQTGKQLYSIGHGVR